MIAKELRSKEKNFGLKRVEVKQEQPEKVNLSNYRKFILDES